MGRVYCLGDMSKDEGSLSDVARYYAKKNKDVDGGSVYLDFDGTYGKGLSSIEEGEFSGDTAVELIKQGLLDGFFSFENLETHLLPQEVTYCLETHKSFNGLTQDAEELLGIHKLILSFYKNNQHKEAARLYLRLQQLLVKFENKSFRVNENLRKEYNLGSGKYSFYRMLSGLEKGQIQGLVKNISSKITLNLALREALCVHKKVSPKIQMTVVTANISEIVNILLQSVPASEANPINSVIGTSMVYRNGLFTPEIEYLNNGPNKYVSMMRNKRLSIMGAGDSPVSDDAILNGTMADNPDGYAVGVYPEGGDPYEYEKDFSAKIKNPKHRNRFYLTEYEPTPLIPKR